MSEMRDKYEKICNDLQHAASEKASREVEKAIAYREGYEKACEDYFKMLRQMPDEPEED